MAQGSYLTPEQLEELARLFVESGGNASAVARSMGVSVSTVTRALARLGKQSRAKLQKQSLRAGLMMGQAYLEAAIERVGEVFLKEPAEGDAIDADGAGKLLNALSKANGTLTGLQRREEQRRQAALTREKTRAEIRAIDARVDELPPIEVLRAKLTPVVIVQLAQGLTPEQFAAAMALLPPVPPTEPKEVLPAKDG